MAANNKTTGIRAGDSVVVLSPSAGLPGLYPWVFEQGLEQLKIHFGFKIIEFPTTRQFGSTLQNRAKDINAAFADKTIRAIFSSIGGSDQIQLLSMLDREIIKNNPKPFFGYSDNTHFHNYLWKLGIRSYYGGSIMTQFAMCGGMDKHTLESIRHAILQDQNVLVESSGHFAEKELDWAHKTNLVIKRESEENDGFYWNIASKKIAKGKLWGGCVESMITLLGSNNQPSNAELNGAVLILETSEQIPPHWVIRYVLIAMGEREILGKFSAVLIGRPKTWSLDKKLSDRERAEYKKQQREIIIKTIRQYNKAIPIVQNLDFGHTDPQTIVPLGNIATINPKQKIITFDY